MHYRFAGATVNRRIGSDTSTESALLSHVADSGNPFNPYVGFSKRVIAFWLAGELMKTQDVVRLPLGALGRFGSLLG